MILRIITFAVLLIPIYGNGQVLSELSDEFDRTCSLSEWQNIEVVEGWQETHLELHDINTSNPGQLTMIPWTTAWFDDYRSNLIFKEVAGDFIFTILVHSSNKAGNDQPSSTFSLSGAMIRTPTGMTDAESEWVTGDQNYVFLSIGSANVTNVPKFEVKSTINSNSVLNYNPVSGLTALIRLVKIDGAIIVLHQIPGEDFVVRQRYDRSDMPDTLQVGMVTYTDWPKVNTYSYAFHNFNTLNEDLDPDSTDYQPFNADLIGTFEYARFENVLLPTEFEGLDFSDENEVTDIEIIDLFSYPSESSDLIGWKIWNGSNSDWNDPSNWSDNSLPTIQDSILIPNCGCPEVEYPEIGSGNFTFQSMIIENGGQVTISNGSTLTINLSGPNARFENYGNMYNSGIIHISNTLGKTVLNEGILECESGANCTITD
ncbi:MAG: hypothetical protein P1U56_10245 [Saprospiraceae bacterium]|nr:hypothetical protein [Saprospiraceae bacterium]